MTLGDTLTVARERIDQLKRPRCLYDYGTALIPGGSATLCGRSDVSRSVSHSLKKHLQRVSCLPCLEEYVDRYDTTVRT